MDCEHEGCHCTDSTFEQEGKKFCSEKCAESSKDHSSGCRCGHPDCAAI